MPRQHVQSPVSLWAQRWLASLESLGPEYPEYLARGRAFARDGRVLRVSVSEGLIEAEATQPSYLLPRHVTIEVSRLPDDVWERAVGALASKASFVAGLLAGDMPHELDDAFASAGESLIPATQHALISTCTCGDRGPVCEHIAAVHIVIAANLDLQPFLLFALRGRSANEVIAAVRRRWTARADEGGKVGEEIGTDASAAPTIAALRPHGFYHAGHELDEFDVTVTPPVVEAALLKRLGKPPFAGVHEDPLPALAQVYTAATRRALQALGRSRDRSLNGRT
jgi:uncharacterized Zn finger protein